MPTTTIDQVQLPLRQLAAVKRRARELGVTPLDYVRQLIEEDVALSAKARATPLHELAAPFREAFTGVSEEDPGRAG
jgi:hypothetical protein